MLITALCCELEPPVCTFALFYFWLTQSAFNSVEELKADELEEIRIDIKNLPRGPQNRPDPLEGEMLSPEENTTFHTDPDIPPTKLIRPDFDSFLGVLRGAESIEPMPASAYLGKIEIRYKDGRRTLLLRAELDAYLSRNGPDQAPPAAPAADWMNAATRATVTRPRNRSG